MKQPDEPAADGEKPLPTRTPAAEYAAIAEIQDRVAALPVLDDRSQQEIIGYNEFGLPS
jgi:hypothetical protein